MNQLADIGELLFPNTDLSSTEKGMPFGSDVPLNEIGGQGWNILKEDMTFPIAILRQQNLLHNACWMQRFITEQKVWLYPHGKTTMAPQLFALQLQHGCQGITAANVLHTEIYLRHGVRSVFIANQVADRQSLRRLAWLCEQYDDADFFLIVDSTDNARKVAEYLKVPIQSRQIKLLIEIGAVGGRTGVRSSEAAVDLAERLAESNCKPCGLEAFEGILPIANRDNAVTEVESLLATMGETYTKLVNLDLFPAVGSTYLSAGGSEYYDLVCAYFNGLDCHRERRIILRSGCYIAHDSGMYMRAFQDMLKRGLVQPDDQLQPALEVWAVVQSQPEAGRAFANAGKRDLSYDNDLPVVNWWYRPGLHYRPVPADGAIMVTGLNDQHSHLSFQDTTPLQVGDMVGFGVSHPCTTFDKWKYLFLCDNDYIITGAVKTFF